LTNDIAAELAKLHELSGAEFSKQVERIALRKEFYPLRGEKAIYTVGIAGEDYDNLLAAARKAVEHGYSVFVLPNPMGVRTADFIFEYKGIYIMYELKTIQGGNSAGSRLSGAVGQSNRILLHMATNYNARVLASDIKSYFEGNPHAIEVLIFKGNKKISVTRRYAANPKFNRMFRKQYEK